MRDEGDESATKKTERRLVARVPDRVFDHWVETYGERNARLLEDMPRWQRRAALAKFRRDARRIIKERDDAEV